MITSIIFTMLLIFWRKYSIFSVTTFIEVWKDTPHVNRTPTKFHRYKTYGRTPFSITLQPIYPTQSISPDAEATLFDK